MLISKSVDMMTYSYCPYSKFCVGAAVLSKTGDIFTGKLTLGGKTNVTFNKNTD